MAKTSDSPGLVGTFSAIKEFFHQYSVGSKIQFDVIIDYTSDPECRGEDEFEVHVTPRSAMGSDEILALWDELSESLHRYLVNSPSGDRFYVSMEL